MPPVAARELGSALSGVTLAEQCLPGRLADWTDAGVQLRLKFERHRVTGLDHQRGSGGGLVHARHGELRHGGKRFYNRKHKHTSISANQLLLSSFPSQLCRPWFPHPSHRGWSRGLQQEKWRADMHLDRGHFNLTADRASGRTPNASGAPAC